MNHPPGLLILLVMQDAARSRRLADACKAIDAKAACIECHDELSAWFAAPTDRIDMIVLDGGLTRQRSRGWVSSLHRLAAGGLLMLLDDDLFLDEGRLRQAVGRAIQRASMSDHGPMGLRPAA